MPCTNNLLGQAKLKRGQMPKDCNKQTTTKQLQAQYVRHGTKFGEHTQEGATPKRPTMYHIHILTYIYIYTIVYIYIQTKTRRQYAMQTKSKLHSNITASAQTLFSRGELQRSKLSSASPTRCHSQRPKCRHMPATIHLTQQSGERTNISPHFQSICSTTECMLSLASFIRLAVTDHPTSILKSDKSTHHGWHSKKSSK